MVCTVFGLQKGVQKGSKKGLPKGVQSQFSFLRARDSIYILQKRGKGDHLKIAKVKKRPDRDRGDIPPFGGSQIGSIYTPYEVIYTPL